MPGSPAPDNSIRFHKSKKNVLSTLCLINTAELLDLPTERVTSLTQEGVGSNNSKQPQSATTSEPPEVEQITKVVDVLTKPSSPSAEVERITTAVKMLKKEEVACTAEWRQALLKKNKLVQAQKDVSPQQRVDEAETANTKAKKVFQQSKHELKQLEKRFASCKFIQPVSPLVLSFLQSHTLSLFLYTLLQQVMLDLCCCFRGRIHSGETHLLDMTVHSSKFNAWMPS